MLLKEYITIQNLSLHKIGSSTCQEGIEFSKQEICLDDELADVLQGYFLHHFKTEEFYHFTHISDLALNEVFTYSTNIFEDRGCFHEQGKNIAKHLYEKSGHPNIKRGELYIVYFKDCILDGDTVDAIGLFKSENKDTFIRIHTIEGGFDIESQLGININKMDKGCLIFNTQRENGYLVSVVDKSNKGEAKYWVEDFLQVKRLNDSYAQTQNAVAMCKSFIAQLPADVDKADKAAMMNRVMEGVKADHVNIDELASSAFGSALDSFNSFKEEYQTAHEVSFDESFQGKPESIRNRAVGSITTIKLDKNFDVNIHGGEQFVERGYDEQKGMKYYKLYFNKEK